MTIPNIAPTNSFYTQITAPQKTTNEPIVKQQQEIKQPVPEEIQAKDEFKPSLFDQISEKVVNPRDINDTVKVPRAIFKGYLSFMVGTTLMQLANITKKFKAISGMLEFTGVALTGVGTFEFVKPFLLKPKTEPTKEEIKKA